MTFKATVDTIRSRMDANFTALRVVYENTEYDPVPGTAFVYFEVQGGQGIQATLGSVGSRIFRKVGLIQAHVYVPAGRGDGVARTHADSIGAIFQGVEFSEILGRAASVGAGEKADGSFWRVTVSIPFQFDEQI